MKPKSHRYRSLAIASGALLSISYAHAQSGTWNVDANGLWSLDTNWLGNTIATGSGSTASFTNDITDDRTVGLDSDRTLTSLVFGDSATGTAGSWIIDNNAVSDNNLILAGTTPGITVNALGTGKTATISAIIEGSSLVKSGTGTLILSGANSYTGLTTVSAGILRITNNTSLGTVAGGVIQSGSAALEIDGTGGAVVVGAEALSISGGGISNGGALRNIAGNNTYGGTVTMAIQSRINSDSGTLLLNNATAVNGAGQNLVVGGAGNITISGAITTVGGFVAKDGAGTLTLSGPNTYTGATSVSTGTIINGSATTFTNRGTLSMSSTGTFDLGGFNAAFTSISSVAGNTITNTGGSNATLAFSNQGNTAIAARIVDGTNKTAVSLVNNNSGTNLLLTNTTNTFSGGLTLVYNATTGATGTRLRINSVISGTPYGTGAITIGQAITDKAQILIDTVSPTTLANDIIVNTAVGTDVGGSFRVDTAGNTLSGKITANLANAKFLVGGSVALTGQVTGSFGLEHNLGAGTVTLNNAGTANNYAGDTSVGTSGINSIMALGRANQIPNGAGTGNVIVNGTLNMGGFSETINGLSGGSTGIVNGVSGTPTLTLGDNNATGFTFGGVIRNTAGTLAVTKIGTGTQILSGTNTYTGTTTVSAGALTLAGSSTGTLGAIQVGGAGTATLNIQAGDYVQGGGGFFVGANGGTAIVSQTGGAVSWNNNGLQLLIGNGGFAGTYNLSGGSVTTAASGTPSRGVMLGVNTGSSATFNLSGTGSLNVGSTNRLMIGRSDTSQTGTTNLFSQTGGSATISNLTMGGPTAAAGSNNNGTLDLSGGTFTATNFLLLSAAAGDVSTIKIGGTAVVTLPNLPTARGSGATATISFDGGTLRNSATGTFITGLTNAFIEDGGAQFDTSLNSTTISQNLLTHGSSLGGGLTKIGANTLTLSGTNTYTGATAVSAGTLYVTGALTNSAVTVQANGTIGRNGAANGGLGSVLTIQAGGNLDLTGATLGASSTGILGIAGSTLTLDNLAFTDLVGWDYANAALGTYELIEGGFTVDFGSTAFISPETAFDFGNGKKGYFTSGSLNAVIIPEPNVAALIGAFGGILLLRRRR